MPGCQIEKPMLKTNFNELDLVSTIKETEISFSCARSATEIWSRKFGMQRIQIHFGFPDEI